MRKLVPLTAVLLLGLVVLAGCGEKEDELEPRGSKHVELMLDYFPNADHAGIYAAQAAGYFEQAGLDVEIRTPPDPSAPIKQVAAGNVDLAISYEPEVFRAREIGLNVVSVAALVQKPLTSIISLPKAKIRTPKDLKGKTVGTAGIDYQTAYLETILAEAGVNTDDVKVRNVGFNLTPALLTGRVDAVLGALWNYEGTDLKMRGKKPQSASYRIGVLIAPPRAAARCCGSRPDRAARRAGRCRASRPRRHPTARDPASRRACPRAGRRAAVSP